MDETPDLSAAAADLTAAANAGQVPATAEAEAQGVMSVQGAAPVPAPAPVSVEPELTPEQAAQVAPGSAAALPDEATAQVATEATAGEAAPDVAQGLEAKTPEAPAEVTPDESGVNAVKVAEATEMPTEEVQTEGSGKKGFAAFLEKAKTMDIKNLDIKALFSKGPNGEQDLVTGTATMFEVNLVPAVKSEMIKAMKLRNLVLFVAIIVVAIFGGIVAIMGSVVAGQKITISDQGNRIDAMSKKISSFNGLSEYLTIKDQLGAIQSIDDQRLLLSRVFAFLTVMLPSAPDSITLSELNVNMQEGTLLMEGQANAGVAPFIDYRVLESFKKSLQLVRYDYGRYVDEYNNEIPTRCMLEEKPEGGAYVDVTEFTDGTSMSSVYAYWLRSKTGCDKNKSDLDQELADLEEEISLNEAAAKEEGSTTELMTAKEIREKRQEIYDKYEDLVYQTWYDEWLEENKLSRTNDTNEFNDEQKASLAAARTKFITELTAEEQTIVADLVKEGMDLRDIRIEKVWRTPNFAEWYHADGKTTDSDGNDLPSITLDGTITGAPHFESAGCQKYSGAEVNGKVMWTTSNDCMLSSEDVQVIESANARDASGGLVLRFQALVTLTNDALSFKNKHVMAIGPNGQNVTDSYIQIKGMFAEAAEDCSASDTICINSKENKDGNE
ncbi:MAG: hypothetical protein Q4E46_01885 [Candidatus Saccharibacteria bacterium]|nr:hypothetical protein [Candidatus Saccharibacteria bacterium]